MSPMLLGFVLLVPAVLLAALRIQGINGHRLTRRGQIWWLGGAEVALVGLGAIATNAATGANPQWPPWLAWLPIGPVAVTVGTILTGMIVAVIRAQHTRRPPAPRVRRVWAMENPGGHDMPRPQLSDQALERLAEADGGTVGLTTALVGAGGFGKTTLARLLCADPRIRRLFRSGVWVTLGQEVTGADLTNKINDVVEQLTGARPGLVNPELAGHRLGEVLDARSRVLLVIDDVWRFDHLRPFLHSGRHATRLVTTRRPDALPASARAHGVRVDQLEPAEARKLLTAGLSDPPEAPLARLLRLTGRWPLLIRLTNAHLVEAVRSGVELAVVMRRLADRIEREGPDALDLTDERSRTTAVSASINASLDRLTPTAADPVDVRRLFFQLAVFAEDSTIDVVLVAALWASTDGLREGQVDRACERLSGLSLVADYQSGRSVRLHDVIRAFLRAKIRADLVSLNADLVHAARTLLPASPDGPDAWWRLPDIDYVWHHLCEHLVDAARPDRLVALLGDLRWAEARIRRDGPAALDADLARCDDPTIATLRRALGQAAHLMAAGPDDDPATWSPADVLIDALAGHAELRAIVEAYQRTRPTDGRPARPEPLPPPDRALRRVLAGHTDGVSWCGLASDGAWLVTASMDGTARIWDPRTGTTRHVLGGHTPPMLSCAISPDDTWLVTTGADNAARVWDAETGTLRYVLRGGIAKVLVTSCAIASDGTWVVTTSFDRTIRVWDLPEGTLRRTIEVAEEFAVSCATLPDGHQFVTTHDAGPAVIWNADSGRPVYTFDVQAGLMPPVVTAGGLLIVAGADGLMRVWDTTTGTLRHTLPGIPAGLRPPAVAPDGAWLLTADADGQAGIWDLATGDRVRSLVGHDGTVLSCAVSTDATLAVTTSVDGSVRLWDPSTGDLRRRLVGHAGSVTCCAIAPDQSWLVTTSVDHTARIWEL